MARVTTPLLKQQGDPIRSAGLHEYLRVQRHCTPAPGSPSGLHSGTEVGCIPITITDRDFALRALSEYSSEVAVVIFNKLNTGPFGDRVVGRAVRGHLLQGAAVDRVPECFDIRRRGSIESERGASGRHDSRIQRFSLTSREQEVVRLLCGGNSNKRIAQRLSIKLGTVKTHLRSVFNKLKVRSRTELAAERFPEVCAEPLLRPNRTNASLSQGE